MRHEIVITQEELRLEGHVSYGDDPKAWVIFAHGSGSSRKSSRNNWVAEELNRRGFGTLLFDLLTAEEDRVFENRFAIPLLAKRLLAATEWLLLSPHYQGQPFAYFGASTGAAAALTAAAKLELDSSLYTVISRGGRPDLAQNLEHVTVPVLLIVGSRDEEVIALNRKAQGSLDRAQLTLIEGATHLFEEPGTLAEVVALSARWLDRHLQSRGSTYEQASPY